MTHSRLTDIELRAAIDSARSAAHDAPKSIAGATSNAWADRSREYFALLDEAKRRGLS